MDPNDPYSSLDQNAIDASLKAYNDANDRYTVNAQNWDRISADPKADAQALNTASAQLDNARSGLAKAASDYSNLLGRVATAHQAKARAAKDPNEQQLWANEAERAQSQSDLYAAEAGMYTAKTQAEIDNSTTRANAALQRAQNSAGRIQTQNERDQTASLLAGAKAAAVPALTQSTIALHNSQIQVASARASQLAAYANRAQEQTDVLVPAQAQRLLAQAGYSQAQIDALNITTPLKADELAAKANLDVTKVKQIQAQISKQQVLPYADTNAPNLDVFQPSTGQITGQPNPAYKNPYMQPLADRAAAIEAIRNDLAAGKFGTGQQAIDYANNLIAGISEAAQLQAQGYTPQQYQQAINAQAGIGVGLLNDVASTGHGAADTMLQYASRARGLEGFQATPYQNAIGMFGGPDIINKAISLISQIQPISDRSGAVDAIARYGAASAMLKAGGGQDQTQPQQAQPNTSAPPQDNGPVGASGYGTPGGFSSGTDDQSGLRQLFLSGALGGSQ